MEYCLPLSDQSFHFFHTILLIKLVFNIICLITFNKNKYKHVSITDRRTGKKCIDYMLKDKEKIRPLSYTMKITFPPKRS